LVNSQSEFHSGNEKWLLLWEGGFGRLLFGKFARELEEPMSKHLTLQQRIDIQKGLSFGLSFKAIGKKINKDQTTVSKEVKRNIIVSPTSAIRSKPEPCSTLMKPPFVCSACPHKNRPCNFDKHFYVAESAHKQYQKKLKESREGIQMEPEEFQEMNQTVSENMKRGQRLYHIKHAYEINRSKSSLYRYVNNGDLAAKRMDLPRAVKFKPRKTKKDEYVPKQLKIGRTYADFQIYIKENNISSWVEMDTVIGKVGGKVIITFTFTSCNFMFGLLVENKTSLAVTNAIVKLKERLHAAKLSFGTVFPVVLTDNGGEFSNVLSIENSLKNERETRLFFCDPCQSQQKARIEKNHTLLRDIAPKGTSFEDYTQETVNLICSHVNGVKRHGLTAKSAYDVFVFTCEQAIADALNIKYVLPQDVIQSPQLLKQDVIQSPQLLKKN